MKVQRALLSVSDKKGLTKFAKGLSELGIELISSSGTANALKKAKLNVQEVSKFTGFPELLEGRVKTLHPAIHAGLLAKRDQKNQMQQLKRRGLNTIDLVAVNLYPFEQTVNQDTPLENALEQIDIGGETLLRAAAKNFPDVIVLVDPSDYGLVLKQLKKNGDVDMDTRRDLARKAFAHVTQYNAAITKYFDPDSLHLNTSKTLSLRYGENPNQEGAVYDKAIQQLNGKGLSYTNILDLDTAWQSVANQSKPAAAIIKHATPCGAAIAKSPRLAYQAALKSDEISAFGGVIGLNRTVGPDLATLITSRFFEAVIAPEFSKAALEILMQKKNLRLIIAPESLSDPEIRSTSLGILSQTPMPQLPFRLKSVTRKKVTEAQKHDLKFAWNMVKQVKSNAIVLVKKGATVGIGAGQMSRVDAVQIAIEKAGKRAKGAVMASDAFFPFPDSVALAAAAGIKAIVQPGGSVKDEEVIEAANQHNIAMGFTGHRVFKH